MQGAGARGISGRGQVDAGMQIRYGQGRPRRFRLLPRDLDDSRRDDVKLRWTAMILLLTLATLPMPAVADLHADSATVRNLRRYPTGQVREMELEGARYKTLIVATLPMAKERGDLSVYTDVAYEVLATGEVVITATRYSELKKYSSPLALRIAPQDDGGWRIVEEASESQP